MQDYRELRVWVKAHAFVLALYRATATFPRDEIYGLTQQLRRSAVSIPSNIAEGAGRFSTGDFRRFVDFAAGSAKEAEYQLLLALELGYITPTVHGPLTHELDAIQRMLRGLHTRLH